MSTYKRLFVPGATYFFSVVAEHRSPLLASDDAKRLLGSTMRACFSRHPLRVLAIVLLPDHLHTIWVLPPDDSAYSMRWSWIKRRFTLDWMAAGAEESVFVASRRRERRRAFWQRRFWEHRIRDEADLEAHFDYIHYNPVKHGVAKSPGDWRWSSFHRWVRAGHYSAEWGRSIIEPRLPGGGGE